MSNEPPSSDANPESSSTSPQESETAAQASPPEEGPSDLDLLTAWQEGDAKSGKLLFERHFNSVYRFFRNKVGEQAEDLTQQTFLGCLKSRDRFRGDSSFRTYLFSIARNQLFSFLRKKQRQGDTFEQGYQSVADIHGPTPLHVAASRQEEALLLRALRMLSVEMQEALELHYWEGMTVREISLIVESPEGTIKRRLQRARARLDDLIHQLAKDRALAESTVSDLDGWAAGLRAQLLGPQAKDQGPQR